jgi:hypothetical protein
LDTENLVLNELQKCIEYLLYYEDVFNVRYKKNNEPELVNDSVDTIDPYSYLEEELELKNNLLREISNSIEIQPHISNS